MISLIAFTVDVDRDVNTATAGTFKSVCSKGEVRFTSSFAGLQIILDVLNELGINGTFFMEGRTAEVLSVECDLKSLMKGHEIGCHGYDHEDLTGLDSGVTMSDNEIKNVLNSCIDSIYNIFDIKPNGFRAPYLHYDERVAAIVQEMGFEYSSSTVKTDDECHITKCNRLAEIPVLRTKDQKGKWMQSYLWPLHEGKRTPEDYKYLMSKDCELVVLGDHSWHMVENYSTMFSKEKIKENKDELRDILSSTDEDFVTLAQCVKEFN